MKYTLPISSRHSFILFYSFTTKMIFVSVIHINITGCDVNDKIWNHWNKVCADCEIKLAQLDLFTETLNAHLYGSGKSSEWKRPSRALWIEVYTPFMPHIIFSASGTTSKTSQQTKSFIKNDRDRFFLSTAEIKLDVGQNACNKKELNYSQTIYIYISFIN